jgi:hypothetical protein
VGSGENINHVDIVIDIISNREIKETYIINKFMFYRKGDEKIFITPANILHKYTFHPGLPPSNTGVTDAKLEEERQTQ